MYISVPGSSKHASLWSTFTTITYTEVSAVSTVARQWLYLLILYPRENEVEDTTAAVLMVDKYGGKDTPGNMAVNTRLPTHAL